MSRATNLVDTLKRYLKAKGMTYKQLADEMGLSETTIKRIFSKGTFSLDRLEEVCRVLDLDLYDLVIMDKERSRETVESFTPEQEQILLHNHKLLIFLYFLINGWTVSTILAEYDYTESEALRMLVKLEKLGLLELHPENQVRMLISNKALWQPDGPYLRTFRDMFIEEFLKSPFGLPNERYVFYSGQFSESSLKTIRRKIDNLIKEHNQLADMDSTLPLEERRSTGLFIGFRSWVFTMISDLYRHRRRGRN